MLAKYNMQAICSGLLFGICLSGMKEWDHKSLIYCYLKNSSQAFHQLLVQCDSHWLLFNLKLVRIKNKSSILQSHKPHFRCSTAPVAGGYPRGEYKNTPAVQKVLLDSPALDQMWFQLGDKDSAGYVRKMTAYFQLNILSYQVFRVSPSQSAFFTSLCIGSWALFKLVLVYNSIVKGTFNSLPIFSNTMLIILVYLWRFNKN